MEQLIDQLMNREETKEYEVLKAEREEMQAFVNKMAQDTSKNCMIPETAMGKPTSTPTTTPRRMLPAHVAHGFPVGWGKNITRPGYENSEAHIQETNFRDSDSSQAFAPGDFALNDPSRMISQSQPQAPPRDKHEIAMDIVDALRERDMRYVRDSRWSIEEYRDVVHLVASKL